MTFGSVTAAPFAKDIMEQCLKYSGVQPILNEDAAQTFVKVPDVLGMSAADAAKALEKAGLVADVDGEGSITAQSPVAGTSVKKGSTAAAVVDVGEEKNTVPNIVGMDVLKAYKTLSECGLELRLEEEKRGDSIIESQTPEAGSAYAEGDVITVRLKVNPDAKVEKSED